MGKNRDRKSLIKVLGGNVLHEILLKNTNKRESKSHLFSEIIGYRSIVEKKIKEHKWSDEDKKYILENVLKRVLRKMSGKYEDVDFSIEEVKRLVDESAEGVFE